MADPVSLSRPVAPPSIGTFGQELEKNNAKSARETSPQAGVDALRSSMVSVGTRSTDISTQRAPVDLPKPGSHSDSFAAHLCNLSDLKKPMLNSLTNNKAVMDALALHAGTSDPNSPISEKELKEFVAMGEHIAKAIQNPSELAGQYKVHAVATHVSPFVPINSNMQSTRALSWYMMARAAQQDVDRADRSHNTSTIGGDVVTDLSRKGTYLMPDPDQALAKFLNSSTLTYQRVSTHFRERSLSEETKGGLPVQRGIEDPARKLPGGKGALLFDTLGDPSGAKPVLFVKFESTGFPQANRGDENGEGKIGVFHALSRRIMHSLTFLESRFVSHPGMERKEHVYKGILSSSIYKPYIDVMNAVEKKGFGFGLKEKEHKKVAKELALPIMEKQLLEIQANLKNAASLTDLDASEKSDVQHLLDQVNAVLTNINVNKAVLGGVSDHIGITRRGGETHISLQPGFDGSVNAANA